MSAAIRFREAIASPLGAPKSASREIFSRRGQAARRKPAYALEASRENWRRYDEARQDRQSLQTDPVGYQDDFNLYAYVANDPLNRADPTGMCYKSTDVCNYTEAETRGMLTGAHNEATAGFMAGLHNTLNDV